MPQRRPTFVLDHDFPDPPGQSLTALIPSMTLVSLRQRRPDLVANHEDWQILQKLKSGGGVDGFITLDAGMLELPKEMVVLHQTRLSLVVIEDTENDPIVAWGMLLIHGPAIAQRQDRRRPQLWRLKTPADRPPGNPYEVITRPAAREGLGEAAFRAKHRLSFQELQAP